MADIKRQSGDWGSLVRRIKRRKTRGIDWKTMIRRIKTGKCTPIISYQVSGQHFTKQDQIVQSWATEIDHPLPENGNLQDVSLYATVFSRDNLSVKEEFLEFLKQRLFEKAWTQANQQEDVDDSHLDFLETLAEELYDLTFSEVATRLGHPKYDNPLDNPLRVLAELPMPIYLTTNYATFMEDALRAAGKEPYTEICYWHDDLDEEDYPSVFHTNPDYHPSVEQPLVYHLHGLDKVPASLVLTQDDYLDFVIRISEDAELVPRRVTQALADSSLMLLGYQLGEWDFMSIFRGLITSKRASRRLLSLSIQYELNEEHNITTMSKLQEYIRKYFNKANFDVYWGDTQNFMQELWGHWEG